MDYPDSHMEAKKRAADQQTARHPDDYHPGYDSRPSGLNDALSRDGPVESLLGRTAANNESLSAATEALVRYLGRMNGGVSEGPSTERLGKEPNASGLLSMIHANMSAQDALIARLHNFIQQLP